MNDPQKIEESKDNKTKKPDVYYMLFELGIDFAVMLALPLLLLIYLGKWADAKTNHHFFVIIGILLALTLSSYMIYKKIKTLKNYLDKK